MRRALSLVAAFEIDDAAGQLIASDACRREARSGPESPPEAEVQRAEIRELLCKPARSTEPRSATV